MFEQARALIEKYNRIIIHRHKNPDGDAIGSQVGMKNILMKNYPDKEVYAVGDPAGRYAFIEDSETDEIPDSFYEGALAIVLDCGSSHLISDTRYTLAAESIRFDHHIFCEEICTLDIVETSFESCCGMVTAFAMEQELSLNEVSARALYTGTVTDSGRFRYDCTSAETFKRVAFLMEQSFDTGEIFTNLYADEYENMKFRASYILKIQFTEKKVAYIYTTLDELNASGKDVFSISRGMVNTMSDIKGSDIWVNFTETQTGVLCELRSSKYNINPIAVKYGGGGHAKASGATVKDRTEAMAMLKDLNDIMG